MTQLRDIMTTDVLTLDPEMSLRDAVEQLGEQRVTGAPVLQGSRLVGVISTTDLIEFQGSNPAISSPTDDPRSLRDELEQRRWEDTERSDDTSSFFVDLWGGTGPDTYQRLAQSDSPEWDLLARHTVGEVMTRKVISLTPETSVREAARQMSERRIHRLLITNDDALVGIVTTMDLVKAIADGVLDRPEANR